MVLTRHRLGNTEVGYFDLTITRNQDVAGLDVAVNNAVAMGVTECGRNGGNELRRT